MVKKAIIVPTPGDRVSLRGRPNVGILEWVNSREWCKVSWDNGGPGLCHLREIEVVR